MRYKDHKDLDSRELLKRMRNANKGIIEDYSSSIVNNNETTYVQPTMRDMLGVMRKLNEAQEELTTKKDMEDEQKKMRDFFAEYPLHIDFEFLDVYPNGVAAKGYVGNQVEFYFEVDPSEGMGQAEIKYTDDFDPDIEENQEIIEKIEAYYETFYKYWEDNILSK